MKLITIVMILILFLFGCSSAPETLAKTEEAVKARNYSEAARYARSIRMGPEREKAQIILSYLKYGDHMLHAAFWENDSKAVEYLAGIIHDIDAIEDRFNAPVLVLAAAWGYPDLVKVLLKKGADPNQGSDESGLTALLWAAKNFDEQLEMAEYLIDAGAEVNVKSKYGETPIKIAELYRNPNIASLLKRHSADIDSLINLAHAAGEGDWIYFSNWHDGYSIYKARPDGSNAEKIADDSSRNINFQGEWIYYENIDDQGKIYRIKADGSRREKITDDCAWNMQVQGEWIYYENIDDNDRIYRIKVDGSSREKLNNNRSWNIKLSGDWIYYINFDDFEGAGNSVYRIQTDGSIHEKIIGDSAQYLISDSEWVYYSIFDFDNVDNHRRIYRVKKDGSEPERIGKDWAQELNFEGDWLYYVIGSDGENLHRIKSDGSSRQAVNKDRTGIFNIVGDWIYYLNRDDDYRIYKVRVDGTDRQLVDLP